MKFSYNWLQYHFDQPLPHAEELATKVGLHSFELEGVEEIEVGGKKDWLLDWDVLPNRSSDCLCYMGIAKEIGAVLDIPAKTFVMEGIIDKKFSSSFTTQDLMSLDVADEKLVKRALKRIAIDVKVGESPEWLQQALESIGQKSINNIVDITNYVMWVTGQPVHAFDYDKLAGEKDYKKISIKFATDGEKVTDLSGKEHTLDSSMLVISDEEKPLDIAGIKGGNNSGVDEHTTRLMISAVNFEYENIRNTSRALKIQTDASKRFENEVPMNKTTLAMAQMSYLLSELAEAEVADEMIDTNKNYQEPKMITCSSDKINSLLGTKLTEDSMGIIFERLGFEYQVDSGVFDVTPSEERLDINIWQDLAEEIGRIYGYENIEATFPEEGFNIPSKSDVKKATDAIADSLVSSGFYEVYNRSLVEDGVVTLENSLNANATTLRKDLLEGVRKKIERNFAYENEPKMFEIGKVFNNDTHNFENRVVNEYFSFAGMVGKKKMKEKNKESIFYETKGYLEKAFESADLSGVVWKKGKQEDVVADLYIISERQEKKVGEVGLNFWEINLESLVKTERGDFQYNRPSKYPKIERDVAFFVPLEYEVKNAKELLASVLPQEATELELFDIYKDEEKNIKSLAFRIVMQSQEQTLSDEFANEVMKKVEKTLAENDFRVR